MSEEKKDLKKSESREEMQETRKLTEEELKKVVGGNHGAAPAPQASSHQYVAGSGCVFSLNCQAASKAECPFGGLKAGEEQDCPKFD